MDIIDKLAAITQQLRSSRRRPGQRAGPGGIAGSALASQAR